MPGTYISLAETGLYYLESRYYDPEVGRFINADSIEYLGEGEELNNYNLYAYCGNNPIMGYDPAGTLDWGAIGRFIGGAVIAIGGTAYTLATIPISIIPGSGFLTEAGLSMAMYGGFMAGSAFDSAIKADMDAIGWNPFNSDEGLVLGSSKVSFYKGQAVVRGNFPGCASFGIMLVDKGDWVKVDTIKHEYGHFIQLGILGLPKFALGIAVPSPIGTQLVPEEFYHSQPWEVTADILGGASQFDHYPGWETIGWLYFFALLL